MVMVSTTTTTDSSISSSSWSWSWSIEKRAGWVSESKSELLGDVRESMSPDPPYLSISRHIEISFYVR